MIKRTMRPGKLFILLFFFFPPLIFSQPKPAPAKDASIRINWGAPIRISMLEGENEKTLSFEGADYTYSDHFLPRYFQQVPLNSNDNRLTASLSNTVYEPLSVAEVAALPKTGSIPTEISVRTSVSIQRKQPFGTISFIPLRKNINSGKIEKLISFQVQAHGSVGPRTPGRSRIYASNSVLQSGKWYKIAVTSDGIYKLSYTFLQSLGIDMTTVNPQNLRLYGNGGGMLPELNSVPRSDDLEENAIYLSGNGDATFDASEYALFYGTGPDTWSYDPTGCPKFKHSQNLYSDSTYYFITFDLGAGKRIQSQASSSAVATDTVTSFDDYAFTENDNINFLKSGRDWYGEYFDNISSYSYAYTFPDIVTSSLSGTVKSQVASRYDNNGHGGAVYTAYCQGSSTTIPTGEIDDASTYDDYAKIGNGCFSFTPSSQLVNVTTTKQTADAVGWMDYVEVNVRRNLTLSGSQVLFRDARSTGLGRIAMYQLTSSSPAQIWDVTDPKNVKIQTTNNSGSSYQFTLPSTNLNQFAAFNNTSFNTPVKSSAVPNQNLHALTNKNMIIIAHPDFLAEASQLATYHEQHDSLTSLVVTPQQIYNEFSSGAQDISGIRDFVKMFYDRAATTADIPQYLLLFGDGSYDNMKRFNPNTNFIPTYQSFNSTVTTLSYVSDDFYGLLDDDEGYWYEVDSDAVDIGIGRFPVKTKAEAQTAITKILAYNKTGVPPTSSNNSSCSQVASSPYGDWRNVVCFIADDEDNDLHITQANSLAQTVDTVYNNYNVDKIYVDAYRQEATPGGNRYPGVNDAITRRVQKGALIMNYTGHGGEVGLGHERFVEISDINSWDNINNMPLFFTATCEFSRFDDPERTSAGETVFLNANGGGIALFSTVRLVFATPNFALNQSFYNKVFTPVNGKMPRLGDLYYYMKNQQVGITVNSRNFTLLGDPALKLAYPKYNVSTDSVNFNPVSSLAFIRDTLRALSLVTVSGHVRNKSGAVLSNYNGVLYPTVYDKPQSVTTLSNDGTTNSPAFTFKLQKNVLYKGKVSVVNGYYKFNFVVPKDIAYQYGIGRISYYCENGTDDANGYYEKIIIGGSNDSAAADNNGPDVKLYMNDVKFAEGGLTDENPDLFALLKDNNGINTVGNGIGHDITAVLDENTEHAVVLNDYYQADLNSYKTGSIRYPFNALTEGKHTLDFKVWDVYNNSSKAHTEFIVAKSAELALSHVMNYPNPFTTRTTFYFEQNQCCQSLEVDLQIFTISGKLVRNFSQNMYAEGYRSDPIEWDGRDDYGDKIGKGVYIYRLKVKTAEGSTAEKYEKLVILN